MSLDVIDHTNSPIWTKQNRGKPNNGARVYSENIMRHYYPVFKKILEPSKKRYCLCTVTSETRVVLQTDYDRFFVFIHQCSFKRQNSLNWAKDFNSMNKNVTFCVWNPDYAKELQSHGLDAMFIPMAVDYKELNSYKEACEKLMGRVIWYGNIRPSKRRAYLYLRKCLERQHLQLDVISNGRYNATKVVTRDEALRMVQRYEYGIGVGMCAAEMSALGVKVILYAYNYLCNIAQNDRDDRYYVERNLCSDDETKYRVNDVFNHLDKIKKFTPIDFNENKQKIEIMLKKYLQNE